jgi:signal transduction histidine kinase
MTEGDLEREAPDFASRLRRSLSAKLLLLTIGFVLAAELILLVPSVSKERVDWLTARIEAAYLVSLALEAPEAEMLKPEDVDRLFATANILGVIVEREGTTRQIFARAVDYENPPPMRFVELSRSNPVDMIRDAWSTVLSRGDMLYLISGEPTYAEADAVEIFVSERALRRDLLIYARNILLLSLFVSSVTGLLLYWSLNRMIVAPVARLTREMTSFQENPEDARRVIAPSARSDEIGVAERTLHALEARIQDLLSQRRRLAALGAGVSKITHDLRNILASAQLMSDRLAGSEDPRVRKLAPRLIQSLDRAIALSRDSLSFARMEPAALAKTRFEIAPLFDEVFEDAASLHADFVNEAPRDLSAVGDRNQLYRAVFNLVRNAVDALTPPEGETPERRGRVVASAIGDAAGVRIVIRDNASGVPDAARDSLFEPFKGSTKAGGSGLGLAIAHEILRAHGGSLRLAATGPEGSAFELTLPR